MLIIFIHISLSLSLSLSIENIAHSTVELQIVQIDHVCSFFPDDTQRKLNLRNWFCFIYKKNKIVSIRKQSERLSYKNIQCAQQLL